jgi:hypothetical protein
MTMLRVWSNNDESPIYMTRVRSSWRESDLHDESLIFMTRVRSSCRESDLHGESPICMARVRSAWPESPQPSTIKIRHKGQQVALERLCLLSTSSGYQWIHGPLLQSTEMKIYAQPSRATNSWEANYPSIVSLWDQPLFIQMESYKILVYCNRHLMTDTHPLGFYSKLP